MSPWKCGVDHHDATCENCGAEHVEIGWAHVCRQCWDSADPEGDQ